MLIRTRRPWELRGLEATGERAYENRRSFLARFGKGAIGAGLGLFAGEGLFAGGRGLGVDEESAGEESSADDSQTKEKDAAPERLDRSKLYPAKRNEKFKLDRAVTKEDFVYRFNNFYEFSYGKSGIEALSEKMVIDPWHVEISGLVEKPVKLDLDEILKRFPLEERLYRFRCVEAWAMAVPWTGFPLASLIEFAKPLAAARFVRFETFERPDWAPNFRDKEYPWPYAEALTLSEARNELAFLATGLYGKPLKRQNGAPIRLVTPWKYGFKSIKSIVKIELTAERPKTFWNTAVPHEYGFYANVEPEVSHPRWSQRREWMLDTQDLVPSQLYNGYAESVASLYRRE